MDFNGHRILVTGAAGFIGSHVAAKLADMGNEVIGCDNFNDYYSADLKSMRVRNMLLSRQVACERIDLVDPEQVARVFNCFRPTIVIHLAAQAGVRYSLKNPAAYIQSNVVAFENILSACQRHEARHLVYASSSSVYGSSLNVPFSERDSTDEPISLYAATKKANEVMAYAYCHLNGLPATGIRFFTVYGPWGRPDMAYFNFTRKILNGDSIEVFANGKLLRDFTYIEDVVESVIRLTFKPALAAPERVPHAIFNVGNNQPVKVLDFISTLEHLLKKNAVMKFLPMQPGDVPSTYADISKLREWTGYAPATPLREGLASFCTWYREFYGH